MEIEPNHLGKTPPKSCQDFKKYFWILKGFTLTNYSIHNQFIPLMKWTFVSLYRLLTQALRDFAMIMHDFVKIFQQLWQDLSMHDFNKLLLWFYTILASSWRDFNYDLNINLAIILHDVAINSTRSCHDFNRFLPWFQQDFAMILQDLTIILTRSYDDFNKI